MQNDRSLGRYGVVGVLSQLIAAPRGAKWSDQMKHPPTDQQVDLGIYLTNARRVLGRTCGGLPLMVSWITCS